MLMLYVGKMRKVVHHHVWMVVLMSCSVGASEYSAIYVFSDSLLDPGNNKYFVDTFAKANYLPYGIDFDGGPTGRFCNGKLLIDFLAELLGLPLMPSYADTLAKGADILSGVNYASAGAGILNDTGYVFGHLVPLGEQISNLKKTVAQLRNVMQEDQVVEYLGRAMVFMDIGSNDYFNNYLQPQRYKSGNLYTPQQFTHLLITHLRLYILEIQGLGLRKFFIAEGYPVGCLPVNVSQGECSTGLNNIIKMYNLELRSLLQALTSDYPQSAFMSADSFQLFFHVRDNAQAYGFKVRDKSCCGTSGSGGTKPRCIRDSAVCSNRSEYMFWDYAHPTEATNRIIAQLLYNTTTWL